MALNIYATEADAYLGWAYFPNLSDSRLYLDGIVVDWESMPGTSTRYAGVYDLGKRSGRLLRGVHGRPGRADAGGLAPLPRVAHVVLRVRGGGRRKPAPRVCGEPVYPPAIAATTRNGSAPEATSSGTGSSAGSSVMSRPHAKKRMKSLRCAVP